ncbi:MAG: amidohydrolase family protein [Candidatus Magnetoovum sp. WYHC-5]|nr:amidohydrolase family protein [Candidatus Magnetoovum sp. WYHC-5]
MIKLLKPSGYNIIKSNLIHNGVLSEKYIVVDNGIIKDIKDSATGFLDLSDYIMSAPFCDYHVHFTRAISPADVYSKFLRYGINSVWDGGDRHLSGVIAKKELAAFMDIKTSGYAIYKENGYGGYIGKAIKTPKEIIPVLELGIDFIKIVNSGIFMPKTAKISKGGFTFSELKETVALCKGAGFAVHCHANGDNAVKDAVVAGVSTIIHGFFITGDTIKLMAQKGVSIIPTVNALMSIPETDNKKNILEAVKLHLEVINKCVEEGVKVLVGSDSGASFLPYGEAFINELKLLAKAGLSVEQVLHGATVMDLKATMKADFILLEKTW